MVSTITSLNRNSRGPAEASPYARHRWSRRLWLFILSVCFFGTYQLQAQCNLNNFTTQAGTTGDPIEVPVDLDDNGQAVLNEAALAGIVQPQGAGCSLYFYSFPSQATRLGANVIISCNGSTPNVAGRYFVVADDDNTAGGSESTPLIIDLVTTDTTAASIADGGCGQTYEASTSDNGIGDCSTMVTFPAPVITENCYTSNTRLTIVYQNGTAPFTPQSRPGNETIIGEALQDSVASWATNGFTRRFFASSVDEYGETRVTFTVTDLSNPASNCVVIVQVEDDEDPEIMCPAGKEVSTDNGTCTATNISGIGITARGGLTFDPGEYQDNCTVSDVEYRLDGSTVLDWQSGLNAGVETFELGLTTVTYRITDAADNDVTCSFTISVVDETAPTLTSCPLNMIINVDAGTCAGTATWTAPTITDNCDASGDIIVTQSAFSGDQFPVGTTTVTYRAQDRAGNISSCAFTVTVVDNELPTITCPADQSLNTDCTDDALLLDYTGTGTTMDNCMNLSVTQSPAAGSSFGDLLTNSDPAFIDNGATGTVDDGDQVMVTLTVTDGNGNTADCSFLVTLDNTTGYTEPIPTQSGIRLEDLDASCGTILLDAPTAYDFNCPPNIIYGVPSISSSLADIEPVGATPPYTQYTLTPLMSGTLIITWTYIDSNNDDATQTQEVEIGADNPPVFVSSLNTVTVNLDAGGDASVALADFFVVVSDDCNPNPSLSLSPTTFDCDDIGSNTVTLFLNDGVNSTVLRFVNVVVQDRISPVLLGVPASANVDCDDIPAQPVIGTDVVASDNCSGTGITVNETTTKSGNPDFCSDYDYTITRTFTATDAAGNQTVFSQVLTVEDTDEPEFLTQSNVITIPTNSNNCLGTLNYVLTADSIMDNCAPYANLEIINTRNGNGADLSGNYNLGLTVVDVIVEDPCGNQQSETFFIVVEDMTPPIASCLGGSPSVALPPSDTLILPASFIDNNSFDNCTSRFGLDYSLSKDTFTCTDAGFPQNITLTVTDRAGNSASCNASVTIQDNIRPTAICQDITLELEPNGFVSIGASDLDGGSFDNCTGTVAGTGNLTFSASQLTFGPDDVNNSPVDVEMYVADVFGNRDTCIAQVSVNLPTICFDVIEDGMNPPGFVSGTAATTVNVPVVVSNFINVQGFQFLAVIDDENVAQFSSLSNVNLPGSGLTFNITAPDTMEISWFDNSAGAPTTLPDGTVAFNLRVSLVGNVNESTDIDLIGTTGTVAEVTRRYNTTSITQTPCTIEGTVVIDNPAQLTVAGNIRTEDNEDVAQAMVQLTDLTTGGASMNMTTGSDGDYTFFPVPAGRDYSVRPSKDINWLNGVDAIDLSLIQRHIVGLDSLVSPYKKIAADANANNSISTADVVQLFIMLRTAVPGPPITPPDNTSWRFVPADIVFPDTIRRVVPAFPDSIYLPGLAVDTLNNDFIAVKIGDVEGNADPLNFTNNGQTSTDDRSNGTLNLVLENVQAQAGDLVEIPVRAKDINSLVAYQWLLEFDTDALEFISVDKGVLSNFGGENVGDHAADRGLLSMVWFDALPTDVQENDVLFTLVFEAKQSFDQVNDLFSISDDYFTATAYDGDDQAVDIQLNFGQSTQLVAAQYLLYQNRPNPFKNETLVSFNLPQSTYAKLTITDLSGRTIKMYDGTFQRGYNEISINRSDLPAAGVLYYQLDTKEFHAIKKMVIID